FSVMMSRQCHAFITVKVSLVMLCIYMIININMIVLILSSRWSRFSEGHSKKKSPAPTRAGVRA
ncbi:MAG: hypothetical protein ACXWT4_12120, partial [Methylobacter sp.]